MRYDNTPSFGQAAASGVLATAPGAAQSGYVQRQNKYMREDRELDMAFRAKMQEMPPFPQYSDIMNMESGGTGQAPAAGGVPSNNPFAALPTAASQGMPSLGIEPKAGTESALSAPGLGALPMSPEATAASAFQAPAQSSQPNPEIDNAYMKYRQQYDSWYNDARKAAAQAYGLEGLQQLDLFVDYNNYKQVTGYTMSALGAMDQGNFGTAAKYLQLADMFQPMEWNGRYVPTEGGVAIVTEDGEQRPVDPDKLGDYLDLRLTSFDNFLKMKEEARTDAIHPLLLDQYMAQTDAIVESTRAKKFDNAFQETTGEPLSLTAQKAYASGWASRGGSTTYDYRVQQAWDDWMENLQDPSFLSAQLGRTLSVGELTLMSSLANAIRQQNPGLWPNQIQPMLLNSVRAGTLAQDYQSMVAGPTEGAIE